MPQSSDPGVRFLVERSKEDPELRKMILNAKPGEVIEWSFPEGTVPMARGNGLGGLAGLGNEGYGSLLGQGLLGITQQGYDQVLQAQLDPLRRQHEQRLAQERLLQRLQGSEFFERAIRQARLAQGQDILTDPALTIRREVEKHLPGREDGYYMVFAKKDKEKFAYSVGVWWIEGAHGELVCGAIVEYAVVLTGGDWKTKLLVDLDEDLHRRKDGE